jgi:oligoribonuclease
MHTDNHLFDEVGIVGLERSFGEDVLCTWLKAALGDADPPVMGGSSVHFDRAWLKRRMPALESMFHYRNLDVSTLKEVNRRWPFAEWDGDRKAHRSLPDIDDSIAEFKSYLHAIRAGKAASEAVRRFSV